MAVSLAETDDLRSQALGLLAGERDRIANAANLSALIFHAMEGLNWVGFYFAHGRELVVGPFQGKPACVRIPFGRGVCGRAAERREIIRVADVDEFEDHIVCDADSRSEIVLPLVKSGELIGVLDIDSPRRERFGQADEDLLAELAKLYVDAVD